MYWIMSDGLFPKHQHICCLHCFIAEPLEASPTMHMKAIRNTHGMKITMTIKRDIKNQRGKKAHSDRTERGKSERRYGACRDGKS